MPLIQFPNVPQVPGVPQLLRQIGGPQVSQITSQFAGADQLLRRIPGVSDFLSVTPNATISQLFSQVPGVSDVMTSSPSFSQILKLPSFSNLLGISGSNILTSDEDAIGAALGQQQWGVYDASGSPIAVTDSFVSLEHSKEWMISKNPVAPNAFGSYNKVERPYEQRVPLAKGGKTADRAAFLSAIESAAASIDLYSVVTPEKTYLNANIVGFSLDRRSERGVSLLIVELRIEEVRVTASAAFSNTKSPAGTAATNGGTVQPRTPSATQNGAATYKGFPVEPLGL